MESNTNNTFKKTIVISVSILLVVAAAYFFFLKDTPPQELIVDEFGNPVQAQVVGQDLIDLLHELEQVTLDTSLFRDQAFISLTDFEQTIADQPRGRNNPFNPI